ncbi:MAG: hypothetical protein WBB69_06720 [Anaerolineales bacterium]
MNKRKKQNVKKLKYDNLAVLKEKLGELILLLEQLVVAVPGAGEGELPGVVQISLE